MKQFLNITKRQKDNKSVNSELGNEKEPTSGASKYRDAKMRWYKINYLSLGFIKTVANEEQCEMCLKA